MVPATLLIWVEFLSMAFTRDWTVVFVPPLPTAGLILMGAVLTMDRRERRRPNWPLIYVAEMDIYGHTFHHDGAPAVSAWGRVARTPADRDGMCDCARAHHVR
jgi:hypothetical protein